MVLTDDKGKVKKGSDGPRREATKVEGQKQVGDRMIERSSEWEKTDATTAELQDTDGKDGQVGGD